MASKYQMITGLYEHKLKDVTTSPAAWAAFLRSACWNYKCRFDEQVLIYAQRPDATAVLEIEKWNEKFGRWVNKGARGIAVFYDGYNSNYRLKHYFDISDTHGSRIERPVPIWQMKPEYEAEVIECLENSFGDLDDKDTFADALMSAARNAVEDNIADYLNDLIYSREDSFLEELDELSVEAEYRVTLENSVAYMLLTRCGIDAGKRFDFDDFRNIWNFNTRNTVNALGIAISDISEMCLREVAATVLSLQRQEIKQTRTFAKTVNPAQNNIDGQNNGRSVEHGRRTDVPDGGRLPDTEPGRAGGAGHNPWQIRVAPKGIPEKAPARPVPEQADGGETQRASDGDRADGKREDGTNDRADGGFAGRDRTDEGVRPDKMGGADE